ncbi:MAG: hypothetical protein AAGJ83_01905 [Planctomycetota bacterium]
MIHGLRMEAWDHTASVMTLIANCNRDPKVRSRPYAIHHVHPFREKSKSSGGIRICKENRDLLKMVVDARQGGRDSAKRKKSQRR